MRGNQRPGLRQFADQQVEALVGRQLGVARADAGPGKDFRQRLGVACAVLPDVQRQQVDAEDFHEPEQVAHRSDGCRLGPDACQVVGNGLQIGVQCAMVTIDAGRQCDGSVPGRPYRADVVQRPAQFGGDQMAPGAIWLAIRLCRGGK